MSTYQVLSEGEKPIFEWTDQPGVVTGPATGAQAAHPFLQGVEYRPVEGLQVGDILRASKDAADFLQRLHAAKYSVVEIDPATGKPL